MKYLNREKKKEKKRIQTFYQLFEIIFNLRHGSLFFPKKHWRQFKQMFQFANNIRNKRSYNLFKMEAQRHKVRENVKYERQLIVIAGKVEKNIWH